MLYKWQSLFIFQRQLIICVSIYAFFGLEKQIIFLHVHTSVIV